MVVKSQSTYDRDMGSIEAKVEIMEKELVLMQADIKEIRDTITGVKGSWKALLAVGSILSGIFVTIGMKLWDVLGTGVK